MTFISDTAAVQASERFDYWRDVICRNYVPATSDNRSRGPFDARLIFNRLGRFEIGSLKAPPHAWCRDAKQIRIDGRDDVLLSMVVSGCGRLGQGGRVLQQLPGEIALYDTRHPFTYELTDHVIVFKIRRSDFSSHAGLSTPMFAARLAKDSPLRRILGEALVYGAEGLTDAPSNDIAGAHLGASIFNLALTIIDQAGGTAALPCSHATQLERATRYAMANLEDASLTCERLARHAGCSVRTLNRLFAELLTTPMRWLWQQRLEAARDELCGTRASSVTDVAFRFGFSELSHFSRSFKSAYGVTPRSMLRDAPRRRKQATPGLARLQPP